MLASDALGEISAILDDLGLVHATTDATLRHLSRAHRFVAVRFGLLRETHPLALAAVSPIYPLVPLFPRLVRVLSGQIDGLGPLWPIDQGVLRIQDPFWLATPADPEHPPQWMYRIPGDVNLLGIYPVPSVAMTAELTATVEPHPLASPSSPLVVPDAWLPNVIKTAAGFVMIASEKQYDQGLSYALEGLGLSELMQTAMPRRRRRKD